MPLDLPTLPESITSPNGLLADPTVRRVELPQGKFRISADLAIKRSALRILAHDTVLVPDGCTVPLTVMSETLPRQGGSTNREYHATGHVLSDTDTLTLGEAADLQAGDIVLVKCGVSNIDPAESHFQCYRTIAGIDGDTVQFTEPLSREITVYDDFDQIVSVAGEGNRYKTGAWEDRGGYYARGLGMDHGLLAFADRRPTSNVTIEGLTIEWQDVPDVYGSGSCHAYFCNRIRWIDLSIINPHDACVRLAACDFSGLEGMTVTGKGDGRTYQNGPQVPSVLFDLWGGDGCYARDINAIASNVLLAGCQVGSVGAVIENAYVRTWDIASGQQLSIDASHFGLKVKDVRFDVPQASSGIFNSYGGYTVENIAFENGIVPDWIHFERVKFRGTIRIGARTFGPGKYAQLQTVIATDGQLVSVPVGLLAGGVVQLSTRTGVRAVTDPTDIFAGGQGVVLPLTDGWRSVSPGAIDDYLALRQQSLKVWLDSGALPVTATFSGYTLTE